MKPHRSSARFVGHFGVSAASWMLAAALLSLSDYADSRHRRRRHSTTRRDPSLPASPARWSARKSIDGAPLGATAYRVLYRSTGINGEPIFVSGVVIVPQGAPPPEGRPIVAWAHPTSGVTPRCAPSLRDLPAPANPRTSVLRRTWLCRGRHRLSGPWHARNASLPRRRQ